MVATAAEKVRKVQKVLLPGQTPSGEFILGVLVKRTYDIVAGKRCTRAEADRKLLGGDQPYGDPLNSSIEFEADFVPFKLATDVVLNGKAHAPRGKATAAFTAALQVGPHRKDVRVIGDRVCRYREGGDPTFTDPKPVAAMELKYENAYGGVDIYTDPRIPCAYPRNYLGKGFVVSKSKKAVDNLALPNLEDPKDPLTPAGLSCGEVQHWERQPMPQSFGWFPKVWRPRALLAGVLPADRAFEQEMRAAYAKFLPPAERKTYAQSKLPDMDFRFFNGASQGLVLPFLAGDEQVRLTNLTPEGETSFQLPGERPEIGLDIGEGMKDSAVFLHTVMIRMEDRQLDLVWRAAFPYRGPDWLPNLKKMEVLVQ
jgi:hypothetical protein